MNNSDLDQQLELKVRDLFKEDASKHREFLELMFKRLLWALAIMLAAVGILGKYFIGVSLDSAVEKILSGSALRIEISDYVKAYIENQQEDINRMIIGSVNKIMDEQLEIKLTDVVERKIEKIEGKSSEELISKFIKQGLRGKKGDKGEQGVKGDTGPRGYAGRAGVDADPNDVAEIVLNSEKIKGIANEVVEAKLKEKLDKYIIDAIEQKLRWVDITDSDAKFDPNCEYRWIMDANDKYFANYTFNASVVQADRICLEWEGDDKAWVMAVDKRTAHHKGNKKRPEGKVTEETGTAKVFELCINK